MSLSIATLDTPLRLRKYPVLACGAAMDVGGWLRRLGLGEYEAKFRDNKIDADVLADLSEGDLEKLGLPVGDRKRLLKAIAGLVGLPSVATKFEPARIHPSSPAAVPLISAERRLASDAARHQQ